MNPQKFWNYISSKTKQHNSIGDLIDVNDKGLEVKTCSDADKAKILNDHFSNVFNKNMTMDFLLMQDKCESDMKHIIIDTEDIVKRLGNLNVIKSPGPDMLHLRVLKEIRNEIAVPLKLIFECSLASKDIPQDWRSGYISPIYKKVKNVQQTIIDQ